MKVGFIGLGKMGMPMSRRLLSAGFQLTVHNRSRGKVEELVQQGAHPAISAAEVATAADIVLTCLPDVPTVEEVFLGKNGIVPAARSGQVLVDHSTVSPAISQRIATAAAEVGARFLDAPVSGGVERATEGTLTIMAGGDPTAFEVARPVFESMGANIWHVGPTGTGSAVKLVNQLLVAIHSLAAAEALLVGTKAGVDPQMLLDILRTSWGASFMLNRNGPVIIERDFANARTPLKLIEKDLGLALEGARQTGAPTPLGERTFEILEEAARTGLLELDVSSLAIPLEEQAGTIISKLEPGNC